MLILSVHYFACTENIFQPVETSRIALASNPSTDQKRCTDWLTSEVAIMFPLITLTQLDVSILIDKVPLEQEVKEKLSKFVSIIQSDPNLKNIAEFFNYRTLSRILASLNDFPDIYSGKSIFLFSFYI